ncbi:hypothetical protein FSLSAGS3026_06525 [Streptococcus agalactiae FSL S3-026]|nr:hypothetical protein FSLSAGS3026_06525 [Streptococcus agalactiae FSL S3-026]
MYGHHYSPATVSNISERRHRKTWLAFMNVP